jgi:hypothetical protein
MPVDPIPTPTPPYANKPVVAALGVLVIFLLQVLTNLDPATVTLVGGAITTLLVFLVSNFKKTLGPLSFKVKPK